MAAPEVLLGATKPVLVVQHTARAEAACKNEGPGSWALSVRRAIGGWTWWLLIGLSLCLSLWFSQEAGEVKRSQGPISSSLTHNMHLHLTPAAKKAANTSRNQGKCSLRRLQKLPSRLGQKGPALPAHQLKRCDRDLGPLQI